MSFILSQADWRELHQQTPQPQSNNLVLDDFEILTGVPEFLGRGYSRDIELFPGVSLNFFDGQYDRNFKLKTPVHEHPFQIMILLSGYSYCDVYPTFNEVRSYFSGSGISPAYVNEYQTNQSIVKVNVEIEPEVLQSHLSDMQFPLALQKQLYKGSDWKFSFYPTVTPAMRSLAHQLWNAPYRGAVKRMYLQAKVFELLALYLNLITIDSHQTKSSPKLKPKTVNALHQAKDILTKQFEHPPSLPQLAQQVGVSQRTLQKGFPLLFNDTVVGYIAQQRLDCAEMLLREGKYSVAEVATKVGYNNMGYFSVAFKGRFGITPSQCMAGKLSNPKGLASLRSSR
ncbi:MAG: AraC family transcriptional regulator [Cyanobacteria bacterium P01_A01_bin.83]